MKLKTFLLLCIIPLLMSCSKDEYVTVTSGELVAEELRTVIFDSNNTISSLTCVIDDRTTIYWPRNGTLDIEIKGVFLYVQNNAYNLEKVVRYSYGQDENLYLYF